MSALSFYVHFPWCLAKCPYCDFASAGIDRAHIPDAAYTDAVLAEIDARWPLVEPSRVTTAFLGGGTPSLWSAGSIARVLGEMASRGGAPDEVTAECNPTSLDEARAAALLEAGVDRISVGVQSLREGHLRFLGRLHDGAGAIRALDDARRAGARRRSADLMYGLPGQTPEALRDDVLRIVDTGVGHVSAYALTIEPQTPFGMLAREGRLPIASDDAYAACHEAIERTLVDAGFGHYEVSNYARPGEEARHNLHTWRGGDSFAVGAGAVATLPPSPGRPRPTRHRNVGDGARYVAAVPGLVRAAAPTLGDGLVVEMESLDVETRVREAWMLGLRLAEGLDVAATAARLGRDPRAGRESTIDRLTASGDLAADGGRIRVPTDRWLVLDRIVRDLL